MKLLFLSVVAILVALCCVQAEMQMEQAVAKCKETNTLTDAEHEDLKKGVYDNISPEGKCFMACFNEKLHLAADNTFNVPNLNVFYSKYYPKVSAEDLKEIIEKCLTSAAGSADKCEKAFDVHKCSHTALDALKD